MSIEFQQPDLTLEKCGQAIALIPRICSHFDENPPCERCQECPLDIAIKAASDYRKDYIQELENKKQAAKIVEDFQDALRRAAGR